MQSCECNVRGYKCKKDEYKKFSSCFSLYIIPYVMYLFNTLINQENENCAVEEIEVQFPLYIITTDSHSYRGLSSADLMPRIAPLSPLCSNLLEARALEEGGRRSRRQPSRSRNRPLEIYGTNIVNVRVLQIGDKGLLRKWRDRIAFV